MHNAESFKPRVLTMIYDNFKMLLFCYQKLPLQVGKSGFLG